MKIKENDWFGKAYKTKDNKKAILLMWRMELGETNFYDFAIKHDYNEGYDIKMLPETEIISEWSEITEEELDKIAEKVFPDTYEFGEYERITHKISKCVERRGFKAGFLYRKKYDEGRI